MDVETVPPTDKERPSFKVVPLREERLERKLTLAFGFMSFIPILIVVWAMVYHIDLGVAIYFIVGSVFIGYFFVARRMVGSMLMVTEKVRAISSGRTRERIEINEPNEIGELARAFNRITQELEEKIEELESSRQLLKKLLSRVGNALISHEGVDQLLSLTIENTVMALEAQMGSLLLVDGEHQELYVKTAWSQDGRGIDVGRRVKIGDGIAGWVAREGQPMRSRGKAAALGLSPASREEGSVLCVPLTLRDKAIGVIAILRGQGGREFGDDDEMLVASIGSQVAVAIENYRLNLDVERTYLETIMALALAVEAKDPYSAGHSKRVGYYATKTGEALGLDEEALRVLKDAGVLHDIGKIGIKDEILLKPTQLTPEEEKIMQQHPLIGEAIVKPVRSLEKVVDLVRYHHERFDGTGYPFGLKGEAIPLGARILSVVDTYDAMITDRPYRKRLSIPEATAELKQCAGKQYDPKVIDAFLRVLAEKEPRVSGSTQMEKHPSVDSP